VYSWYVYEYTMNFHCLFENNFADLSSVLIHVGFKDVSSKSRMGIWKEVWKNHYGFF